MLQDSLRRESSFAINLAQLSNTLTRHPHLASLVRRLEVKPGYINLRLASDEISHLLRWCQPRHIQLDAAAPPEASYFIRALRVSGQRFQSLYFLELSEPMAHEEQARVNVRLWRMLAEQTDLKELSIRADVGAVGMPETFTASLVKLVLYAVDVEGGCSPLFRARTRHSSSTLLHAEIYVDCDDSAF